MRLALAAVPFLALAALPAAAALLPQYYDEAREVAANVVIVAVETIDPPASGIGTCTVHGTVEEVERGTLYAVGEAVQIDVDCYDPKSGAALEVGGTIFQDVEALTKSARGKAWLDEQGRVMLSQYEQLP